MTTYLLCFRTTPGDQPTPTRKPIPYIHIQFIGFVIFSTYHNPYIFYL